MCIFCKIANGEIPSNTVYEDEYVRAFLDLSQAGIGHTLVVPKKHFSNVLEIDEVTFKHAMNVARLIAKALVKAFNCEGVNILNNCGEAAGQTVFHFHIHVIPRFTNDNVTIKWIDNTGKLSDDKMKKIKEKIIMGLEA